MSDATDYFEGLTPGTNIPIFKGVETPAYGAPWSDEYQQRWNDWYYRNGSIQNGMFVAKGATPDMYRNAIALGIYNPAQSAATATKYLEDNPKVPWDTGEARKGLLDTASVGGRGAFEKAFTDLGLDPKNYATDIESRMASILSGVPATAKDNFESYFTGQPDKLITDLTTGYRKKATDAWTEGYPDIFVPQTADDPFIETILGKHRTSADDIIKNMLARGTITEQGSKAAYGDLDKQSEGAKLRLNEIGAGLINTGEADLDTQAGKKRSAYDTLTLGAPVDVAGDLAGMNKLAQDFIGTLGTGIEKGLGSTQLFDTSGLGAIAGAAQGGQNTKFDPKAGGSGTLVDGQPYNPEEDQLVLGQDVLF
jgi:hypothetical protein